MKVVCLRLLGTMVGIAAMLSVGCGGDDLAVDDDGSAVGGGGVGGGGSGGAGGSGGQRTLDNCETNIDDDVPPFYKKYFRCVDISMNGPDTVIRTVDLPPHQSGYYVDGHPNYVEFDTSQGHNKVPGQGLVEQDFTITIPGNPVAKGITIDASLVDGTLMTSDQELPAGASGVSLNSVAYFSGAAGMGMNIAMEANTFDAYQAHHAMGQYHYHGQTPGPLEVLLRAGVVTTTVPGAAAVELYAIMCDGTVVLGCTELDGGAVDTSDMDAQGGHLHDVADDSETHFVNRYHTHVCPGAGADFSPEIQFYSSCP